jgi:hypothetical protein
MSEHNELFRQRINLQRRIARNRELLLSVHPRKRAEAERSRRELQSKISEFNVQATAAGVRPIEL